MRTLLCLLTLSLTLHAQSFRGWGRYLPRPKEAPFNGPSGLVKNGNFTENGPVDNWWDGVNVGGGLQGDSREAYALTENGRPGEIYLPISVNCVDLNGDGLPDIETADPSGIMRVYFNSGTPTEPSFTIGEVVPIFLSRPAKDEQFDRWWSHGMPKIAMYDWDKNGSVDLLYGNYGGELVFIPNSGSPLAPNFAQPAVYSRSTFPTSKKGQLWGNLFAPCVYDWNKDGKPDILIGEGSYSANAVHLLINDGTNKFSEESRYFLCFGDGREHLSPAVVDWNGDGEPDVLVADRSGAVAVHLRQPGWKPGDEVKFSQFVDFGGTDHLKTALTIAVADLNGDGLFDLILGRSDGKVQAAYNKGSKEQPKFERPADVKGTDLWGKNILKPSSWTSDDGSLRGNLYGYVSVVDQPSPAGGKILKMGYWPSPNKLIKLVHPTVIGNGGKHFWNNEDEDRWFAFDARRGSEFWMTNTFTARQPIWGLKTGVSYTLSYKARGKRITEGACTLAFLGIKEVTPTKYEKKERGATPIRNEKTEELFVTEPLTNSSTWKEVSKTFVLAFKDKDVKTLAEPTFCTLEFRALLAQYDGECEICDVSLKSGEK